MKKRRLYAFLFVHFLIATTVSAQVTFTDVTEASGLLSGLPTGSARSTTWGDYDSDGDLDVVLMNGRISLHRNEGNGTFLNVTQTVGITDISSAMESTALFLDFDNDGDLDLYVGKRMGDVLYRNNGDGTFLDVSQAAGINTEVRSGPDFVRLGMISFDYDSDGLLDIYITDYGNSPNRLYYNQGNGRFKEIAAQVGWDGPDTSMGIALGDYDNDEDLDLFITVDRSWNREYLPPQALNLLYRNEGDGVFINVAEQAGVEGQSNHRGFFWDYDNDGDLDLFWQAHLEDDTEPPISNFLYRNNGDGVFTEVTQQAGIESLRETSRGASYGDFDNDGWLDLGIAYQNLPTFLYHNNGDGTFTNISTQAGIGGANTGATSFVDYDGDGNLDLFIGADTQFTNNPRHTLYRNNGTVNRWLGLKLIGVQSNRDAIGSRVKVIADGLSMLRDIAGASGRNISQQDRVPLHFGLGANLQADLIEIRWPSGIIQTFTDIPSNQWLTIDESEGILVIVRDISPVLGDPNGNTVVRIQGEHFLPGSRVLFGGVEAKDAVVVSPSLVTAFTPPGPRGYIDVEVIHPDGKRGILKDGFRYTTLRLSNITPDNGPVTGGSAVQIEGFGFQLDTQVQIGGKFLTNVSVTPPTLIRGTTPSGVSGVADVSVTNPDGEWDVLYKAFTYVPPPEIGEISSTFVPLIGGGDIQISGSGFQQALTVQIGGITVQSVEFLSPDELNVHTPLLSDIGPQDVVVINPNGQRAVLPDGVMALAPIEIKSVEPISGGLSGGTRITIVGEPTVEVQGRSFPSRFAWKIQVLIGNEEAKIIGYSDNTITAITPPNKPGPKDIKVINGDDQSDTLRNAFTYNNAPVITKVTPDNGKLSGGTEITIQGSGFLPGAKVLMGIEGHAYKPASSVEVVSSTVITAVTPPDSKGARIVMVFNPDQQYVVLEDGFTYNAIPTIVSITPNYGSSSGGTKVVIAGTGFLQGARVMVGDRAATAQVEDDATIEAIAPAIQQGVWDVRVINPDTQEAVKHKGFISVGEVAYNYPNPFRVSQGTTFRYVTNDTMESITVKIFNLAGVPIDVVQQTDSNEVKWQNADVHAGIYIYLMEVEFEDGKTKQFRNMLEVHK